MLTDVAIHLALESGGAIAMRCALGACNHVEHVKRKRAIQAAVWATIAVPMSFITVQLVG